MDVGLSIFVDTVEKPIMPVFEPWKSLILLRRDSQEHIIWTFSTVSLEVLHDQGWVESS